MAFCYLTCYLLCVFTSWPAVILQKKPQTAQGYFIPLWHSTITSYILQATLIILGTFTCRLNYVYEPDKQIHLFVLIPFLHYLLQTASILLHSKYYSEWSVVHDLCLVSHSSLQGDETIDTKSLKLTWQISLQNSCLWCSYSKNSYLERNRVWKYRQHTILHTVL